MNLQFLLKQRIYFLTLNDISKTVSREGMTKMHFLLTILSN